uniref:28 kDa Metastriate family member n=1 Tax=Rhipicephalus zambeziensis TaxID=60191 RepID=A0A224YA87_9ACAR
MNPAGLLVFILYIAATGASDYYEQYYDYEWTLPEIGRGVNVYAKVLYDSTLKSTAPSENEVTEAEMEPTIEDFKKLFKSVEEYFQAMSIMINIEVKSADKIDDLGVPHEQGSLNANATLEKLKEHVASEQDGNNTIYYLFTKSPLLAKENEEDQDDSYMYYGTFETFCSEMKSAVVVHHQSMEDYSNAVGATAWMFGLTGYDSVEMDFFTLLWVFQYCPKSTCPAHCSQQCPA